jgi:hypothetical protein
MRSVRSEAPKAEDAEGATLGDVDALGLGSLLHAATARTAKAVETKDFMRFSGTVERKGRLPKAYVGRSA